MKIRRAQQQDVSIAADLILSSGPSSLNAMFNVSDEHTARGFIYNAFQRVQGQFGHCNHLVLEIENAVVAVASCWTSHISKEFRSATLQSLVEYFGVDITNKILVRSQYLAEVIPAPQANELGIGHIATVPEQSRQGVATTLLEHFVDFGKKIGKEKLVLDVEQTNDKAIALYTKFGFEKSALTSPGQKGAAIGLTSHWHMYKLL